MVNLLFGLAKFIPGLVRFFKGKRAGAMADNVLSVVRQITGIDDPAEAVAAIQKNLELQIQLKEAMAPIIVAEMEAETRQLESVNETMRAELNADSKFTKWWRPTFGYVAALTWAGQMFGVTWLMFTNPEQASTVITAMASLSVMWTIALSVLGVYINKRSQDKQLAAGKAPPLGIIGALAKRIAGGKKKSKPDEDDNGD